MLRTLGDVVEFGLMKHADALGCQAVYDMAFCNGEEPRTGFSVTYFARVLGVPVASVRRWFGQLNATGRVWLKPTDADWVSGRLLTHERLSLM